MLKLTKPMMHGSAVKRLQEMLNLYAGDMCLLEIDEDGVFGECTSKLLKMFQDQRYLPVDGIYGPTTEKALVWYLSQIDSIVKGVVDITNRHDLPKLAKRHPRSWQRIDGVTLHQTGCRMPSDPTGWVRVNAHYGLTQEGVPILINDPMVFIWHAQKLSHTTIGVEIEGNYCGIEDNERTLWRGGGGPHTLNDAMLEGADLIMRDIKSRFDAEFKRWEYIYAHRQSSGTRRADPGEEIWKKIAERWSTLTRCKPLPNVTHGTGRPLPKEWGHEGKY